MSWSNVLRRAGSFFCVKDNFLGTFVDFRFKIFSQERTATYDDDDDDDDDDPCP